MNETHGCPDLTQSLNQVEKLEDTELHEDLMLISLDNGRGTLIMVVVN